MKKLILLLLCAVPALSFAQTGGSMLLPQSAADSTVTYSCSFFDAQFVAGSMPAGSPIIDAITWATESATDSAERVHIIVTQGDLVTVAQNSRYLPEGWAAEVNARLYINVLPLLPGHPWLMTQMIAIKAGNQQDQADKARIGLGRIHSKRIAFNRQN